MSFAVAPVATSQRARAFTAAVSLTAVAAAAGGAVAIAAGVVRNDTRTLAAVTLVAALSFVASGLVAWRRRPDVWTGPLMVAAGFALFAGSLANSNSALPFTIGLVLAPLPSAIIAHLILSFPEGRLHSTLERLVIAGAYFVVFVVQIVMLMFMGFEHVTGCPCPTNLLFIRDDMALHSAIMSTQRFLGIALAIVAAWIVVRRWQNASAPLRRALAPILLTGSVTIVLLLAELIAANSSTRAWAAVSSAERVAIALVPIAYLVGLYRARLGRVAVSDLVIELGRMPEPGHLRDALARALRDPSLELAYWIPESEGYIGIDGQRVEPVASEGRTVTVLERHGRRIAALVHDPALAEDPALLNAVSTAAGLALENERLLAELRAQLEQLRESRARIVEAGDTERRRLERNLHDGAQQRLVSLALTLDGLPRVHPQPHPRGIRPRHEHRRRRRTRDQNHRRHGHQRRSCDGRSVLDLRDTPHPRHEGIRRRPRRRRLDRRHHHPRRPAPRQHEAARKVELVPAQLAGMATEARTPHRPSAAAGPRGRLTNTPKPPPTGSRSRAFPE